MTEKSEDKGKDIGAIITTFVRDLDALSQMLETSMIVVIAADKAQEDRFREFAGHYGEKVVGEDGEVGYRFARDYAPQAMRIIHRQGRVTRGLVLLPRGFVVSLVSTFDAYLGSLLAAIYTNRPELLDAAERSLNLAEIKSLGSIDAAVDFLLAKEIESLLRQSHAEQFSVMEKRFNVKLREGLASWPRFVELTQRRNCFVHNGGVASSQYFRVCREHGVVLDSGVYVGDILDVTPDYFEQAHSCLFEIGVKLGHVLWRKLLPQELDQADSSLISVIFDLLSESRWALASNLADFSCDTLKRHASEKNRRICLVNQAQAYKWSGNAKRCAEIVEAEDWSASSGDFRLAQQVLCDDFESAANNMRKMGPDGAVSEVAYANWPLFREFRKTDDFLLAFEEVFGKAFVDIESIFSLEQKNKVRKRLQKIRKLWEEEAQDESSADVSASQPPNPEVLGES